MKNRNYNNIGFTIGLFIVAAIFSNCNSGQADANEKMRKDSVETAQLTDSMKKLVQRRNAENIAAYMGEALVAEMPEDTSWTEDEDLDSAVRKAVTEYKTRGYCFYTDIRPFSPTLIRIMDSAYHPIFYSDTSAEHSDYIYKMYYNACMFEFFKEKYGWNILQKLFIKSQKMDGSGMGNRQAVFPGGRNNMMEFIYCRLNLAGTALKGDEYLSVRADLYISPTGQIDSIDDLRCFEGLVPFVEDEPKSNIRLKKEKKCIAEARRVLSLLPAFLPATKDGRPVQGKCWVHISFNQKIKNKYKCN